MTHDDHPRSPAGPPSVRVAMFAGLAEAAGARNVDLTWSGGTVADLRNAVGDRLPAAVHLLARSAVVVAGRYAADLDPVPPGADVAILPPVSGG